MAQFRMFKSICEVRTLIVQWFGSMQGLKLRLTGHQCDQKLSVGDQNFKTGRQQATNLLSPRHLKVQGKRTFLERKHKAPVNKLL